MQAPESVTNPSCACSSRPGGDARIVAWTTTGGVLAAIGICAACCLLPAIFVSIGIAGAWVSSLDALTRYKWVFVATAAALLGFGYFRVYGRRRCANCLPSRALRVWLWAGTALAIAGIVYGYMDAR